MKKYHALYIAVAALALGGCGSAGGSLANAITDPFTPRPHGKSSLAINQDPNNGILNVGHTVADTVEINGRTYGNNSTLDIGHNFQNRLSDFTYVLKQSGRNVESGQLGVYKRAYSAVVGATVQDPLQPQHRRARFLSQSQLQHPQHSGRLNPRIPTAYQRLYPLPRARLFRLGRPRPERPSEQPPGLHGGFWQPHRFGFDYRFEPLRQYRIGTRSA